jgi:hypothetical protein
MIIRNNIPDSSLWIVKSSPFGDWNFQMAGNIHTSTELLNSINLISLHYRSIKNWWGWKGYKNRGIFQKDVQVETVEKTQNHKSNLIESISFFFFLSAKNVHDFQTNTNMGPKIDQKKYIYIEIFLKKWKIRCQMVKNFFLKKMQPIMFSHATSSPRSGFSWLEFWNIY